MKIRIYQVDAFTDKLFGGNPAAVCPLEQWLPDELMQQIAMENNLAETAFYIPDGDDYQLRWMTPTVEVQLCGHATLATAHVLFQQEQVDKNTLHLHTKSGRLTVTQKGQQYEMDFPADFGKQVETPEAILTGMQVEPVTTYLGKDDYMVVLKNQKAIEELQPDFRKIGSLTNCRGIIATAPGEQVDFVSRCFYPQSGIDEDPTTGSAHTLMTPYWAERLNKNQLTARQLSKRIGDLQCELVGERVKLTGSARTYLVGEINI